MVIPLIMTDYNISMIEYKADTKFWEVDTKPLSNTAKEPLPMLSHKPHIRNPSYDKQGATAWELKEIA